MKLFQSIAKEKSCQSKTGGGDAKDQEHIIEYPTANFSKLVEENDPKYKIKSFSRIFQGLIILPGKIYLF